MQIATGLTGAALIAAAAFAAGIEYGGPRRSKRSIRNAIAQPAARMLRLYVIMIGVGLIVLSLQWPSSVTWTLNGIVAALIVAEAAIERRVWLRRSRSRESSV